MLSGMSDVLVILEVVCSGLVDVVLLNVVLVSIVIEMIDVRCWVSGEVMEGSMLVVFGESGMGVVSVFLFVCYGCVCCLVVCVCVVVDLVFCDDVDV